MAKKKYDLITDLYTENVKEITASPENWPVLSCALPAGTSGCLLMTRF